MRRKSSNDPGPGGFAEVAPAPPDLAARHRPADIEGAFRDMFDRRRSAELNARSAVRKAARARAADDRARAAVVRRWIEARNLLRAAVAEVETALSERCHYLGMADEGTCSPDLAAIEIRLFAHGVPYDTCLDITVIADGRQIGRDSGGPAHRTTLPNIAQVTVAHYRAAILAYVKRVLPAGAQALRPRCRLCGQTIPGGEER